jgi:hypothetical protein
MAVDSKEENMRPPVLDDSSLLRSYNSTNANVGDEG